MAVLTYQSKTKLKKAVRITLIALGVLLLLAALRFLYLGRYLVYNEDGVQLQRGETLSAENAEQPLQTEDYVLVQETATAETPMGDLPSGCYITTEQLMDADTRTQLSEQITGGSMLLLDVKTLTGKTLYPSAVGSEPVADAEAIAEWIRSVKRRTNLHTVARFSAYRDSAAALSDFSMALPISGGALWIDANGSYCLNPASDKAVDFLYNTALELSALGFDEICFDRFDFPYSPNIVYKGDGQQAAIDAAKVLSERLVAKGIAVSFGSKDAELLSLSAHEFVAADGGTLVADIAREYVPNLRSGDAGLVFLTSSKDTRFSAYGVLTPPDTEENG